MLISKVKENAPLVHCITNYVTVTDCANGLLAVGASPIMADQISEVADIVNICNALVLNIGTANERTAASMLAAGRAANQKGIPVLLDPVGVGASVFRRDLVEKIMQEVKLAAIRGNASEIRVLAKAKSGLSRGVDVGLNDLITLQNMDYAADFMCEFCRQTGAAVSLSGAIDIVADQRSAFALFNGHEQMTRLTGCGCLLSAITGAFLSVAATSLEGLRGAASLWAVCGELAYEQTKGHGLGAYHTALLNNLSLLDDNTVDGREKCEKLV